MTRQSNDIFGFGFSRGAFTMRVVNNRLAQASRGW